MTSLKKVNSTDLTPLPVPVLPMAVTEEAPTTVKQGYNDSNNDLNTCVVCFKTVDIYSIGECDHPVCYECSARMRVLCRQNECPICRRELSQVIFTNIILPYRQLEINNRSGLYDKKYRVCFSSQYIQKSFNKLLDNSCPKCNAHGFHKFSDLKDHVRREHELFYCDICTDNLRIFSFERKCYNRQELGLHRRKGDPDNTSHRGHPLCQFCDCRYLDRDELFRHLRRNHFFCHLCDLDGCNQFYGCYDTLREHFRNEHYLCEEGDCFYEKLTAVFRSEIDLKAHMSKQHSKSLGKVATRQARTLELEFTLAPRNRSGQGGGGGNREGGSGGDQRGGRNRLHNYNQNNNNYNNEQQNENDIMVMDNVYNVGNQNNSNNNNTNNNNNNYSHSMNNEQNTIGNEIVQNVNRKKVIDAQNEQEFPSLGGPSGNTNSGGNTTAVTLVRPNLSIRTKTYGPANLVKTKENFPALGSSDSSGTASPNFMSNNSNSNGGGHYSQGSASALLKKPNVKNNQTKKPQSGMVIHVSNRPKSKHMDSDFPALPGSASNSNHTITQTTKQQNQNRYALAADMDALPKTQGQQNLLLNMNAIAAKHRSLVDEYVPMSSSYNAKLTLINSTQQKPQLTQQQQQINDSFNAEPPRLNSKNNFPSLGGGNSRNNSTINQSLPQQWIMTSSTSSSEAKQQMKKTKPTPPPSFNLNDYKTNLPSNNNKKQNNNILNKTSKDVAGTTSILTTGGGNNNNKKEKKKNNEKKENNNNNSNVTNNNNKNIIKTNNNNNKKEKFNNNNNINENDIKAVTGIVTPETKKIQVQEQKTIINNKNNQKSSSSQNNQVQMKNLKINDENSFPALGEMTNFYNSNITDKPSPVTIKPPPGFDNSNQNVVPPPGFNSVTLNSVARAPSNNLTFTNSLGESYSILPQHYYKPPTNSVKRNQVLVQHFQDALNSIEAMEQFRQISQMFRDGDYMALPYYEHCRIALNSKFDEIFPELLTLLPDISKQQELYLVHSQYIKDNITDVKKRTMQQSLLDVCETCKQVLRAIDLQSHMQTHTLENNFPTLGGSNSSNSSIATTNSTSGSTSNNINQQKQSAQSAWKK